MALAARQESRMNGFRSLATTAMLCLAIAMAADRADGQPPDKSAKERFVGTWTLVSIHYLHPDGSKVEPFGPDAKGMLVFDGAGRFGTQIMAAHRPRFASNNRMLGTPEENKGMAQGVVAYFGTYSVSEAEGILTLHIERSSFPNWDGTDQKRSFSFNADELRYTAASSTANPSEAAQLVWKRAR
jgi:lipocalin-like protein